MRNYEYFSEEEKAELDQLWQDGNKAKYIELYEACASKPVDWPILANANHFGKFTSGEDQYYGYLQRYIDGEFEADTGEIYTEFEPMDDTPLNPYKVIQQLQEQQDATKPEDQKQGYILRISEPKSEGQG